MNRLTLTTVAMRISSWGKAEAALLELLQSLVKEYGESFTGDEALLLLEKIPDVASRLRTALQNELAKQRATADSTTEN